MRLPGGLPHTDRAEWTRQWQAAGAQITAVLPGAQLTGWDDMAQMLHFSGPDARTWSCPAALALNCSSAVFQYHHQDAPPEERREGQMDIKQDEAGFQIGSTVRVLRGLTVAARAYTYTLREIRGREAMIDNGIPDEPSLANAAFSVASWVPLRDLELTSGPLRLSAAAQVALARREERAQADARAQALQTEIAQLRVEMDRLVRERDEARRMLGQCTLLSGADPDGNGPESPHLWPQAVAEVQRLRQEYDELVQEALNDEKELVQLRALRENLEALHAGLMGDRAAMLRHSALQDRLAFPLESVLRHSADAIEHLFQAHDCDAHGHEVWREAGIVAAIMADTIGGDHGR